jgi:hypothetical protein
MLQVELNAVDNDGVAVASVEIWEVSRRRAGEVAVRVGITDAAGHLVSPLCYMGTSEYAFWKPIENPVRLELFTLHEGYASERLLFEPPTETVLADGSQIENPPGYPVGDKLRLIPNAAERAFRIQAEISLRRARKQ